MTMLAQRLKLYTLVWYDKELIVQHSTFRPTYTYISRVQIVQLFTKHDVCVLFLFTGRRGHILQLGLEV